jgi:hypothetical protein
MAANADGLDFGSDCRRFAVPARFLSLGSRTDFPQSEAAVGTRHVACIIDQHRQGSLRHERTAMMGDRSIDAGLVAPGEYAPAGEAQGVERTFAAAEVAAAFGVAIERVYRAMAGEFALAPDARVHSRQAQYLAEVILGDLPQAEREAALMRLGAFTPRRDHDWGIGEAAPGEESDKVEASADSSETSRP